MYEWGTKLTWVSEDRVDSNYQFQKGEMGKIVDHIFQQTVSITTDMKQAEIDFTNAYKKTLASKGATVKYIRVSSMTQPIAIPYDPLSPYDSGIPMYAYEIKFQVEECHFVGDPCVIDDIVVIALIIAGLTLSFMLLYPAIVYKLAGAVIGKDISPSDAFLYNIAQLASPFMIIVVIAVIAYIILQRRK